MPTLNHYLVLSAILFAIGTAGVFVRRNLITILLSIEIMLNAVNLTFVAFGRALGIGRRPDHRVLRHDRRGRRSGRRPGHRDRAVPAPRVAQPRRVHGAEMVTTASRLVVHMLLLIPLLPFLGFLLNASFGRRLAKAVVRRASRAAAMLGVVRACRWSPSWQPASRCRPSRARSSQHGVHAGSRPATSTSASRCGSIRCRR